MEVIAVFNAKGGTGKSTSAVEIATGLKQRGYEVLLLDLDEQADSSFILGAEDDLPTIYDALMDESSLDSALQTTGSGDVVMGDKRMASLDRDLEKVDAPLMRIRTLLEESKYDWDYVIIDLPPHSGLGLYSALSAADSLVIPVLPSMLSLKAVQAIEESIEMIQQNINPDLRVKGFIINQFDSRPLISRAAKAKVEQMAEDMGVRVLGTIRRSSKAEEAHANRKSIQLYAPRNNAAKDWVELMENFLED